MILARGGRVSDQLPALRALAAGEALSPEASP